MTTTPDTVPASSVDLLLACASSAEIPDTEINTTGEAAMVGNAVHESSQACLTNHGTNPTEASIAAAIKWDVRADEVERLTLLTLQGIESINEPITAPTIERVIPSSRFRTRVDLLDVHYSTVEPRPPEALNRVMVAAAARERAPAAVLSRITIVDIKTGRDVKYTKPGQMLTYAAAAREHFGMPSSGYIYTGEVWSRDGTVIERRITSERIDGFLERVDRQLRYSGRYHTPGSHCGYCRRIHECDARAKHIRSACEMFIRTDPTQIDHDKIGAYWDTREELRKALDVFDEMIGVQLTDGPITIAPGRRLELVPVAKKTINPRAAVPIMKAFGFSLDEVYSALSLRQEAMLKIAANKNTNSTKKATRAKMLSELDDAGAISVSTYLKRTEIKD